MVLYPLMATWDINLWDITPYSHANCSHSQVLVAVRHLHKAGTMPGSFLQFHLFHVVLRRFFEQNVKVEQFAGQLDHEHGSDVEVQPRSVGFFVRAIAWDRAMIGMINGIKKDLIK